MDEPGARTDEPGLRDAGPDPATPDDQTGPAPVPAAPGRVPRDLLRRVFRMPRSRAGIFALLLVLGGAGLGAVFGGVSLITWTETADFCGRCHSMEPELAAHASGPHR
jgi:hypothetical protein